MFSIFIHIKDSFAFKQTGIIYKSTNEGFINEKSTDEKELKNEDKIGLNKKWEYAKYSKINSGSATFYKADKNRKNIIIAVNAGHGTKGGTKVKTKVHPDGSAKVTSGTTKAGAKEAVAISYGMTFLNGKTEAEVNLETAILLKKELLSRGYDVLMLRDEQDVQLDNIARTVIANNIAAAHVSLHFDSTNKNKGAYFMKVADNKTYKNMEPVKSNWKNIDELGTHLIKGLKERKVKIFSKGSMEMDLTQTSYSTIPSVVVELGDKASDISKDNLNLMSKGLADGIDSFFIR